MVNESVDGDRLPTVEEIVGEDYSEFYKEATLYWNGKQFVVGIPKKLVRLLDVKEGDRFAFKVKLHPTDKSKDILGFDIVKSKE